MHEEEAYTSHDLFLLYSCERHVMEKERTGKAKQPRSLQSSRVLAKNSFSHLLVMQYHPQSSEHQFNPSTSRRHRRHKRYQEEKFEFRIINNRLVVTSMVERNPWSVNPQSRKTTTTCLRGPGILQKQKQGPNQRKNLHQPPIAPIFPPHQFIIKRRASIEKKEG